MYRFIQLSIVIQMLLSSELWWPSNGRLFPVVPVVDALESVPNSISGFLSSLLA